LLHKTTLFAIFSVLVCASHVSAQTERQVVTQFAEWFAANSTIKVHKRVAVYVEGNARFAQAFDPMQFQLRTGVDIEINKHWSVMPLGYVYTWNPLYGKQPNKFVNNEHRTYQQVVFKHKLSRASISHRMRLEQRFTQVHKDNNGEVTYDGYDLHTNRLRYRLNANIPLNKPKIEPGALYAVVYDEIFLSFGDMVTYKDPDQNRVFAGLGYAFSKHMSFQGGPFYQMLIKSGGTKQENNIGFALQLSYNVDLTKEQ
jgi:hypothetical protein